MGHVGPRGLHDWRRPLSGRDRRPRRLRIRRTPGPHSGIRADRPFRGITLPRVHAEGARGRICRNGDARGPDLASRAADPGPQADRDRAGHDRRTRWRDRPPGARAAPLRPVLELEPSGRDPERARAGLLPAGPASGGPGPLQERGRRIRQARQQGRAGGPLQQTWAGCTSTWPSTSLRSTITSVRSTSPGPRTTAGPCRWPRSTWATSTWPLGGSTTQFAHMRKRSRRAPTPSSPGCSAAPTRGWDRYSGPSRTPGSLASTWTRLSSKRGGSTSATSSPQPAWWKASYRSIWGTTTRRVNRSSQAPRSSRRSGRSGRSSAHASGWGTST